MNISVKHTLVIGLLLLVPMQKDAKAQPPAPPRIPIGVYAVVPVENVVNAKFKLATSEGAGITTAGMNLYLTSDFYPGLLENPAVSGGLALQVHWDTLNPNPPGDADAYFWDYVDDAFSSVNSWNTKYPDKTPKTIQLIVSPGFNSPQWVRDELTSCDGLFSLLAPVPGSTCGYATFTGVVEEADSTELPMPWNMTYQAAWKTFLQALAKRYNENPSLVSIAVAGPTAASAEMLLPHGNQANQMQFMQKLCSRLGCVTIGQPISPNNMWKQLLSNAGLPETDQAFIDAWNDAIDTYGDVFGGLTLVATTGNGLPDLTAGTFPPPSPFEPDCTHVEDMDCQAETTILSYFMESTVGGFNAKATQTSGLEASREGVDLGIDGVKFLSQLTKGMSSPSTQILGGAQFDTSVANNPTQMGSDEEFPSPSRVQALYNVLGDYFNGTPVGGGFFGGTFGTAPLNYLQIYYQDIQYATDNQGKHVNITTEGGTVSETFQDLLNTASGDLRGIAESEP